MLFRRQDTSLERFLALGKRIWGNRKEAVGTSSRKEEVCVWQKDRKGSYAQDREPDDQFSAVAVADWSPDDGALQN
jgi:hypothetical protein